MSNSKNPRRGSDEKWKSSSSKKSASFHGRIPSGSTVTGGMLRRPKTQPDLLSVRNRGSDIGASPEKVERRLTKLLLNVTVQRSLGAVQVIISPECTVGDFIGAAIRMYVKEGRRPFLQRTDPADFQLHYSQFSLESLDPKEKLLSLGSRNFFLCPKPVGVTSCSGEAEKPAKTVSPWLRFMDFLL